MTITPRFLKNTHLETVVRMGATGPDSGTISLAGTSGSTGLANDRQVVMGSTGPRVSIAGVTWTGTNNCEITITRGGLRIMTLPCTGTSSIDFSGQVLPLENTNEQNDIVVATTLSAGGSGSIAGECWLKLRKTTGYADMVEEATYGAYDDPTRVGASTTVSGSPDKV